ncbi:MAG: TonB-dependent receptor [Burkholderiales bacterium]|nr:TonB-dependent receptor [Burkholderiales bacterium]
MFKKKTLCTSIVLAFSGTAMLVAPAYAQEGQRVEVTGSRIKSLDGSSNSPISSVSEEQINESLPVAIEEVIRGLPAAVPAIGPGTNNGTSGAATIDLRGLGSNRSLVLLNGRRMVPFNLAGEVDTNTVPMALLKRVDLVTGGASAVYGADAVAGVVNFVLDKNFKGVEGTVSYGLSEQGDAARKRADLTIGASLNDGKGNVVLSLGAVKTDPLLQGARPYGQVSRSSTSGNPQGSFTTVPVYIDSAFVSYQLDDNGNPSPAVNTYNFNPLNYYQTPLDRFQATAMANYQISDAAEVYAELLFTRSNVVSNLAPSGTFFNTFSIPIGNPFINSTLRADLCAAYGIAAADCVPGSTVEFSADIGRRFVELGPRINDFRNKTIQTTIGVKGAINDSWGYDVYFSHGEADQTQLLMNWGSSSKVQQALRAVSTTDCLDASNGCVPLNIFGPAGSITPAMLAFINLNAMQTQQVKQDVIAASINGDLGSLRSPFSTRPISVAFGAEERKLTASTLSDAASQIGGEILGTGAPNVDSTGTFKLSELYAEAVVPLVTNAAFAKSVNLEMGYRHSSFKTTSSTDYGTWKFGGSWEPMNGLRLRAMAQKATRAPNVSELFAPVVTQLDNMAVDPCEGTNINPADIGRAGTLTDLCVKTGVPTNRVGSLPPPSAGQVNVISGGNTALKPEEARSTTIGFQFEPSFVPGLAVGVDYYKINIEKAITTPSVDDVIASCYDPKFNPGYALVPACALIGRGPSGTFNGSSAPGIALAQTNLGKIGTSGFDVNLGYRTKLSNWGLASVGGTLDMSLQLNDVQKYWSQATPASVNRDCRGYYSVACGAPNYKQKFSQRTTWSNDAWRVGYNWRHVSGVIEEPGGTNFLPAYSSIPSYDYVDLSAEWKFNKNLTFNLAINNLFDKAPPEVGNTIGTTSTNSGNTFPQNYDVIGRAYTLGATFKF